jgi:nicotinate phosphoribosyltransferase
MTAVAENGLLTDSYHLSMIQGYLDHGLTDTASFELFVRKMPHNRNFLVAAGLEQVLELAEELRFTAEEVEWLRSSGIYREPLLSFLEDFRFSGEIHAMPEGSVFFQYEPILRVEAPLPEAQLLETRIINLLHYQTLVASKAARVSLAARDRLLVDFGLRRAHGAEAGLFAARASYIGGFDATSTVLAGRVFGIPVSGTMAHSFIEAHDSEKEAFENFARSNPTNAVLLLDTYDTARAAVTAARLARVLEQSGVALRGVRLDSGDLAEEARRVRQILDDAGLHGLEIYASGGIDELEIAGLLGRGAPIDGFGVGTHLTTSEDAPYLDCAYKLTEYAGVPRRKTSPGKATLPGRKQVFRRFLEDGVYERDTIALMTEAPGGSPLLKPFMLCGERIAAPELLPAIRGRCLENLKRLPEPLTSLTEEVSFDVWVSPGLEELAPAA